jgi:hypothetical protein
VNVARRRFRTLLAFAGVALALVAWASRDMLADGMDQLARKRCCQRMRVFALRVEARSEQRRALPRSLQEWAAQEPDVADAFGNDLGAYELVPPEVAGSAPRDPASTVLLVERRATHPGPRHALFADLHVDVAPPE